MASDYRPQLSIVCITDKESREYSGVVFEEDETFYHVLTCAHGTQDLDKAKIKLKCLVFPEYTTVITNISLSSDLIKQDSDIDIGVIKLPKVEGIRIKPMKLANASLMIGTECISYGYVRGEYIKNQVSILTLSGKEMVDGLEHFHHTQGKQKPLLIASGEVISGLSGGPLVHQNQIFGIQSSGDKKKKRITYCPSDVICQYLGEEYGF